MMLHSHGEGINILSINDSILMNEQNKLVKLSI